MIFADLHNHTNYSDGDFIPQKLVKIAGKTGIKAIGITDHDTVGGLNEAVIAGKHNGIEVIPGVEVSIRIKQTFFTGTLHLLCYFSEKRVQDEKFMARFQSILANGRGSTLVNARVKEINKVFGPKGKDPILSRDITFEDISCYSNNASSRHFAIALKEKHHIKSKDTINAIISNNSPAYLPSGIDLNQVSGFIKKEKLLAVLAHPAAGSFPGGGHYKEVLPKVEVVEELLPEFLDAGVKGIEVYYPGHDKAHEVQMLSWAKKYDLVATGGSDCHDAKVRPFGISGISEHDFIIFKRSLI
ncbi:MAG: PHP domain-containing protein [Desulfobacteraceae bacterium]|nr:PHP domain-containing protein [Desulfobacteraceae bacterium]